MKIKDIRTYLSRALADAVRSALPEAGLVDADVVLEQPKRKEHGDISTPLALSLSKKLRRPPPEIAKRIMSAFVWNESFVIPDPDLGGTILGGFINFRLSPAYLHSILATLVDSPNQYGRDQVESPRKMLFEFVSANPTGPMVVVNARAAAIGDVTARLNEWIGHQVEREYYINDAGNQIDLLAQSIAHHYYAKRGEEFPFPEGGYAGAYISELAESLSARFSELSTLDRDGVVALLRREALVHLLSEQKRILHEYGVDYDRWFSESTLHASGRPQQVADALRAKGLVYEQDGAVWFRSTTYGDEKDRVIIRQDGTPTYFLADIAYHLEKASRGYDESTTFWGPDHHGYLPRLEGAIRALDLGNTTFRNFIIQQVNLMRDGQPYRMSKRRGEFVTMADLIEEVGVDAARYFFLMRRLSSHFDFDMDLAVKKGDDNPVYYVQYAHARTAGLIRHAWDQGFTPEDVAGADAQLLTSAEERDVLLRISDYPNVVFQAALSVEPHRITMYLEELAAAFHHFYHRHRIVTEDKELSKSRLLLTLGVKNLIGAALGLLGISAPDRM